MEWSQLKLGGLTLYFQMLELLLRIDLKGVEDKLGKGGRIAYDYVREHAEFIENDKDIEIYDEINKVSALVDDHSLVEKVLKDIELDLA